MRWCTVIAIKEYQVHSGQDQVQRISSMEMVRDIKCQMLSGQDDKVSKMQQSETKGIKYGLGKNKK
jgi:hypothetical protein